MMKYYVVHTKTKAEQMVADSLRRAGFEALNLRYKATVSHARYKREIYRAYFPRYVFAGCDNGMIVAVNRFPGVSSLVHACGEPLEVPGPVIAELRARGDDRGLVRHLPVKQQRQRERLENGQYVKVEGGPFQGFWGQVEVDNGDQVKVWVEELNRRMRVTLLPEALSPVVRSYAAPSNRRRFLCVG